MASSLDNFNALPMNQRVGIIAGAGLFIALVLGYMLYSDLGKLGNDPDNLLGFMIRDTDEGIWREIETLNTAIAKFNKKAKTLDDKKLELAEIEKAIVVAREQLPAERERSKIGDELGDFAVAVVNENLGSVFVRGVEIKENSSSSRSSRSKKRSKGPQPLSITFVCNLDTDVDGLIAFINKVERSNRFMTVDGIKIKPGKVSANTDGESPELSYSYHNAVLEINTWVLQE